MIGSKNDLASDSDSTVVTATRVTASESLAA